MGAELSIAKECEFIDTNASLQEKAQFTIQYGCENRICLSSDLAICSISNQHHSTAEAVHTLKMPLKSSNLFIDVSSLQIQNLSSPSPRDGTAYEIPVIIDSLEESLQLQLSLFSENYESLLNRNSPLSLKYLCREFILNLTYIRTTPVTSDKIDASWINSYLDKLLEKQCYWKQFPLPVSVKMYLNGSFPICTHVNLFVSRDYNPVMGSPYNLAVLPQVKIVRISGGQGGYVAVHTSCTKSDKIEDFIISPSYNHSSNSTIWIMITVAPNHFIFESVLHPNRYIFAPDPIGKTYCDNSKLFLSRPFYAGPENVFSLVGGGTPYPWVRRIGHRYYGIKSVKWSTKHEGMFWRWQSGHYHQASKPGDKYLGDECYTIEPFVTTVVVD